MPNTTTSAIQVFAQYCEGGGGGGGCVTERRGALLHVSSLSLVTRIMNTNMLQMTSGEG